MMQVQRLDNARTSVVYATKTETRGALPIVTDVRGLVLDHYAEAETVERLHGVWADGREG